MKQGFTLAELLIVIGIISILVVMGLTTFRNQTIRARNNRREADLQQIRSALEMYRLTDTLRRYPTGNGAASTVLSTQLRTYLPTIPQDPLAAAGLRYHYQTDSSRRIYDLCAHLEQGPATPLCGAAACGSGGEVCNYRVFQP